LQRIERLLASGKLATLRTGTRFAGNILALASITATTGVSISGSMMALTGAVTMDTNNVSVCSSGSGGVPPDLGKCEERHDKDGDGHDRDKVKVKVKDNDKDHKDDRKDRDHGAKTRSAGNRQLERFGGPVHEPQRPTLNRLAGGVASVVRLPCVLRRARWRSWVLA
jgi:hypothetical protein